MTFAPTPLRPDAALPSRLAHLGRTALALALLAALPQLAQAQDSDPSSIESWEHLDLLDASFDTPPDPEVPLEIDEIHTFWQPTLIRLPSMGAESMTEIFLETLEGEADLWIRAGEEAWSPFEGQFQGEGEVDAVLAVVPQGKARVAIQAFFRLPCATKWSCPSHVGTFNWIPSISLNLCIYDCVFVSDILPGCSGLTPGQKRRQSNLQFGTCAKTTTIWNF